jgi:hypothetical protein
VAANTTKSDNAPEASNNTNSLSKAVSQGRKHRLAKIAISTPRFSFKLFESLE